MPNENELVISGYCAKFNVPSEPISYKGTFVTEYLHPGAFRDYIKSDVTKLLVEHQTELILASTESGTLALVEDEIGLAFEAVIDLRQSYAKDVAVAIERGDILQCSFYCAVPKNGATMKMQLDKTYRRDVYQCEVPEITITGFPAYKQSTVAIGEWRGYASPNVLAKAKRVAEIQQSILKEGNIARAKEIVAKLKGIE